MDILYVKVKDRNILIKTNDDIIDGALTNQLDLILSHLGFVRLNQNTIASLNKIKSYDSELSTVYFDDEKLISCQVSRRNKQKVLECFDKIRHD